MGRNPHLRFSSVPGDERQPIGRKATRATLAFRDLDPAKPYALPELVILGGTGDPPSGDVDPDDDGEAGPPAQN